MRHSISYFPKSIILGISFLVAHQIVAGTQPKSMVQVVQQLNYWVAMAFSWPFTFVLMYWIHALTRRLDLRHPWHVDWKHRLSLQLSLGVVLVLLIDLIVVRAYFWAFDNDFDESGYLEIEFQIIFWMVLFMNAAYTAWYFSRNYFHSLSVTRGLKDYIRVVQAQVAPVEARIGARLGNKVFQVPLLEIACFERHENIGRVHLVNGKVYNVEMTMPVLLELLEPRGFYQINRSVLISLAVIKGYQKVKNQQAEVILKEGISLEVSLLISRNRLESFKLAFEHHP